MVANELLSLSNIENDILRRGNFALGFGYIKNPLINSFLKRAMVDQLDPRIHFALNCGAVSCPPIRFYNYKRIDSQLNWATQSYLDQDIEVINNKVNATALFRLYPGDFRGKRGILQFLRKYNYIDESITKISFRKYNWSKAFNNYAE